MTMFDHSNYDEELAEKLHDACDEECGGCLPDIGIQLALIVREHYDVKMFDMEDVFEDEPEGF